MLRALVFAVATMFAAEAAAADIRVGVADEHGRPVADAVATLEGLPPTPARFAWPMRIAQHNMQFDPFVLIVPVGASVAFPNLENMRHQVYSFSPAGPFELSLYGHDESRSVTFRNVGIIAIGCNIHDQMTAFIDVVDTPYAMKTGADGVAVLHGAPQGAATLRIWHPYLRAANNRIDRAIVIGAGDMTQAFQVRLRPPPDHSAAY